MKRLVVGFGRFWYKVLVGDDWKIAVAVVTTMVLGAVVLLVFDPAEQIFTCGLGVALMAVFAIALRIDVRSRT
jgi:hypothetical protein